MQMQLCPADAEDGAMEVCVLGSGSAGNAAVVSADGTAVLIDAGLSARALVRRLDAAGYRPADLAGILITHEHTDHIQGLPRFLERHPIPVYHHRLIAREMARLPAGTRTHVFGTDRAVVIGALKVRAFDVPHDARAPVGFTLESGGKRVAYVTDLGEAPDVVRGRLRGADLLVLEANHDCRMLEAGPYPAWLKDRIRGERGHLSNEASAATVRAVAGPRLRRVILVHLSRRNNDPAAARDACVAACPDADIAVTVASQDRITERFSV